MSNTDANKKIVTEFIDGLFTRGDLGAVDAYLSEHHLKSVFTKVGVGSRGELTARILFEHYGP